MLSSDLLRAEQTTFVSEVSAGPNVPFEISVLEAA